jgi:hypothetical protein
MRYFKRLWTEPRGDRGPSWRYFEVDDRGRIVRQIEAYDDGTILKYGPLRGRAIKFDPDAMTYEIGNAEFERRWATAVFPGKIGRVGAAGAPIFTRPR